MAYQEERTGPVRKIVGEVVSRVRERIRAMTPGELPPLTQKHPVRGLINDIRRFIRRTVFGQKYRSFQ